MTDPITRYRALVREGKLAGDAAQERAVELLELLHRRLSGHAPRSPGLRGLLNGLGRKQSPRGLYLFGDVGRGKSMLMDLFYAAAPVTAKRRVHFYAFMQEVHDTIAAWRKLSPAERQRHPHVVREAGDDPIPPVARGFANGAALLCFDEFQVEDIADAMILSRLFEALFAEGVVVVATSNCAPRELYAGGLNRQLFLPFIALVEARLDVHRLDGPVDYRLTRLAGNPVYFTPLGPAAAALMDRAWARLTDGDPGAAATVAISGRRLIVPQAARGAARFAFSDLAEQPLGAADYLALARRFHTLFIDAVPRLGRDRRNETRRFIALIDTLYEHRVKLVCSAAAAPEALHDGHDPAFARTASRLMEMQSAAYLARGHGVRGAVVPGRA